MVVGSDCRSYKLLEQVIFSAIAEKSDWKYLSIRVSTKFDWNLILWEQQNKKGKWKDNQLKEVDIKMVSENKEALAEILKIVRKLKVTELVLDAVSMQDLEGITEDDLKYIRFLRLENMKFNMKDLKKLVSDGLVRI